jgi:hypothetical protein
MADIDGFCGYDDWKTAPPDDDDPAYREQYVVVPCPCGARHLTRGGRAPQCPAYRIPHEVP